MHPQNIHAARVLEIGCCDGGNLIPMAMTLPGSEFVGIDLTESDIADARRTAAHFGLTNVRFEVFDLTNLPGPFGRFDYIVVHGLYAWLPLDVREQLLAVVQASLSPQGVAYVSYNSKPGCILRQMLREMMLFHTRNASGPAEKITQAREFLVFMKNLRVSSSQPAVLRRQLEMMINQPDHALFHDELAPHYHPVYFHEFAAHASRCGLQYLSEAGYFETRPEFLGSEVSSMFMQAVAGFGGDPVRENQYLDFVICSYFHQTLLCHDSIALDRPVDPARFQSLHLTSPATAAPAEPAGEAGPPIPPDAESFVGSQDSKITTASPFIRAVMHSLIDSHPEPVPFASLPGAAANPENLSKLLLALLNLGLVSANVHVPPFCLKPGDRPTASPLARWQAELSRPITNLRHGIVEVEPGLPLALLPLLDGTRTRADLFQALQAQFPDDSLPALVDESLDKLARLCLLQS
jgi:methyltransferase-like protein/ubiquinone/menaquinone biosynthesis C-methylase UbiE